MKTVITLAALGAAAVGLAACDQNTPADRQEEQLEQQAEDVTAAGEQNAAMIEEQAENADGAAADQLENNAEAVRESTEVEAERIEEQADNLPDQ